MLSQTTDQLLPLLQMLEQPAFCIRQDGMVLGNQAAKIIAPVSGQHLSQWLGSSADAYEAWNRLDSLSLPIPSLGPSCTAVIQSLTDGTLFLLSQCDNLLAGSTPLAVTAQVLRQPLTDLSSLTQRLSEQLEEMEDPTMQAQTAAINRQIYRLSRIACNLADLDRLQDGSYQLRPEKLDLLRFLQPLFRELQDVCRSADRQLICTLPQKSIVLSFDPTLLERAILHLLSNALKYGLESAPIYFSTEITANTLLFQMRNVCRDADTDLLSSAFNRLQQRNALPDPQWGLGLGLPMVRYIAQLMGGTVAVEVSPNNEATITMSIKRKKSLTEASVNTPPPFDYTGGMRHSLLELSDCLPNECFDIVAL